MLKFLLAVSHAKYLLRCFRLDAEIYRNLEFYLRGNPPRISTCLSTEFGPSLLLCHSPASLRRTPSSHPANRSLYNQNPHPVPQGCHCRLSHTRETSHVPILLHMLAVLPHNKACPNHAFSSSSTPHHNSLHLDNKIFLYHVSILSFYTLRIDSPYHTPPQ